MNASNLVKYSGLLVSCFLLLATVSCKKSSSLESPDPVDPGYGCNSNVVLETFTNTTGRMLYNPGKNAWWVIIPYNITGRLNLEICDSETLQTIVAGHTLTDTFSVVLSGNIKRLIENQVMPINSPPTYPIAYLLDVTAISE